MAYVCLQEFFVDHDFDSRFSHDVNQVGANQQHEADG